MKPLFLISLAGLILSGCATVNRGATDYFRIDTVPQGAKATTSIETSASLKARAKNNDIPPVYKGCDPTPCSIALPRRSEFIITLEQAGYENAEMYITNSSSSGSFTANMAATTVTTAGATAVAAGTIATVTTGVLAVSSAVVGGSIGASASVATFGLIPAQTAISTGISAGLSSAPVATTSSVLSAAIPPALLVTGGLLLTDVATGANVNLFPNPVVLQLAPKGTPIKVDPNVAPFRNILDIKDKRDYYCNSSQKFKSENQDKCQNLKTAYNKAIANKKASDKAAREKFKAAQKEAKLKDKTP